MTVVGAESDVGRPAAGNPKQLRITAVYRPTQKQQVEASSSNTITKHLRVATKNVKHTATNVMRSLFRSIGFAQTQPASHERSQCCTCKWPRRRYVRPTNKITNQMANQQQPASQPSNQVTNCANRTSRTNRAEQATKQPSNLEAKPTKPPTQPSTFQPSMLVAFFPSKPIAVLHACQR